MSNTYKVIRGKITNENGLPCLPRWFCDDRLSVKYDRYGIDEIQYFSYKVPGHCVLFTSDAFGGMKFYIDENRKRTYLELGHTEVMPYGFVSMLKYGKSTFRFEQRIVNNCIYMNITPQDVHDTGLKFAVEFYDSFGFKPYKGNSIRYRSSIEREWDKWIFEDNVLSGKYTSDGKSGYVSIGADTEIEYIYRPVHFTKNIVLLDGICERAVTLVMAFDDDKNGVYERLNDTLCNRRHIDGQIQRYEKVMEMMPVLESPYEDLNNFISMAPLYHESFKLKDYIGANRAKTTMYWVWGWDNMTAANAYAYWGDVKVMGDMLRFFMETSHPEKGLAHAYNRDMSHGETSMVSAQGFYLCLLYVYYKNGGDITPYFEFAKKILNMIFDKEVMGLGLCSGKSLVPDFRELILENGNDISTFNNISAYCAVRSMEEMAKAIGDKETNEKALEFAAKTRENFNKILYDTDVGYYASSADSITLEKRKTYMGMELKFENSFAEEILASTRKECLKFFEEKFVNRAGINVFPLDNIAYDADANQAHDWFPTHSEYYTRAWNKLNRTDLAEQFIGWIENWTKLLMCPEGINCYVDTEEPYLDEWNADPGTWQAFAMRGWYEAVIHSIFGVTFEQDEVIFYPYSGKEMSIFGLNYYGKKFNIHMKGSGPIISSVEVNGKTVCGVDRISVDMLSDINDITVNRASV